MRPTLVVIATLLLAGCYKPPEAATTAGPEFVVERLFTHEGCTVYRFDDGGNRRYFTDCSGSTSWRQSCGKNCSHESSVSGGGV